MEQPEARGPAAEAVPGHQQPLRKVPQRTWGQETEPTVVSEPHPWVLMPLRLTLLFLLPHLLYQITTPLGPTAPLSTLLLLPVSPVTSSTVIAATVVSIAT